MVYFRFELKKWVKSSKNQSILLALIIFLIGGYFVAQHEMKVREELNREELRSNYLNLYSNHQVLLHSSEGSDQLIKAYSEAIDNLDEYARKLSRKDWKKSLNYHIDYLLALEKIQILGGELPSLKEEIKLTLAKDQYFLEKNIEPIDELFGTYGWYYIITVLRIFFSYGGTILICLLFFDLYVKEVEENTILLLNTLPLDRKKIGITKLKMSLINSLIITSVTLFISFFIGSIFSGKTGSLVYPIVIQYTDNKFNILLLYQYIIIAFLLFNCFLFFMLSCIYGLSFVVKNSMTMLYICLGLSTLPSLFLNELLGQFSLVRLLPFYYEEIGKRIVDNVSNNQMKRFILEGFLMFLIITMIAIVAKKNKRQE
ncbi:ABC transporter permease subunit [Carnobacterium gallinarum]|uniref:ABC transporter permease subunit n=1 Tax=Carnobacterium gallinarum TaxID=2749 RepID=UPI000550DFE5|nr:ABC transporter permease subunit [Carnobacterium gallinarum]